MSGAQSCMLQPAWRSWSLNPSPESEKRQMRGEGTEAKRQGCMQGAERSMEGRKKRGEEGERGREEGRNKGRRKRKKEKEGAKEGEEERMMGWGEKGWRLKETT